MAANTGMLGTILQELCEARGHDLRFYDDFGRVGVIRFADGGQSHFKVTTFDINGAGAAHLAKDKDYAARILAAHGIRAVPGELALSPRYSAHLTETNPDLDEGFPSYEAGERAVARFGFPLIVKPNDGSGGKGVARVEDAPALNAALGGLFSCLDHALIQPCVTGTEYRVVVLNGRVLVAYARHPLRVIGDGTRDIAALLAEAQSDLLSQGRRIRFDILEPQVTAHLAEMGLSLSAVPATGQDVALLPVTNLSLGGSVEDVTEQIHPGYLDLISRIGPALGLRYFGLDLFAADITRFDPDHQVLEVNGSPGMHHFAALSEAAMTRVRGAYAALVDALAEAASRG